MLGAQNRTTSEERTIQAMQERRLLLHAILEETRIVNSLSNSNCTIEVNRSDERSFRKVENTKKKI